MTQKSKSGWLELILGILLILPVIYTFINPSTALTTVVIIYGLVSIVTNDHLSSIFLQAC